MAMYSNPAARPLWPTAPLAAILGGIRRAGSAVLLGLALALALAGAAAAQADYVLDAGDRVKISVFGEPDLTGEFEIDGAGSLSFPLIGTVPARGLTPRALEDALQTRLLDGYLVNPQVSVEVLNYRPFYIIGEVNSPGSYPYRSGMNVINAVALAGGFTFRADEGDIEITRGGEGGRTFEVQPNTTVLPGDVVRVKERFF